MHLMQSNHQGETTMTTTNAQPLANYLLHDQHRVCYRADKSVTCDTCSLSATVAAAVGFMYDNGVLRLSIDGAPLKRI